MGGGLWTGSGPTKTELVLDKLKLLKLRYSCYMQEQQGTAVLSGRIFQQTIHSKQKKK